MKISLIPQVHEGEIFVEQAIHAVVEHLSMVNMMVSWIWKKRTMNWQ
jgi:hypothetical protein